MRHQQLDTGATPFENLDDVRRANRNAGHFFFSPGAHDYFKSQVETGLIRGRYFITSEQREDGTGFDSRGNPAEATERRYTVRYAQDNGHIETVSAFMEFPTSGEAMTMLLSHDMATRASHDV